MPNHRCNRIKRATIFAALLSFGPLSAQSPSPEIVSISPNAGPEGTRVHIRGNHLQGVYALSFGLSPTVFLPISNEELVAIVPHKASNSKFTVLAPQGRSTSPLPFAVSNDPRIPGEVSYKAGYVNTTRAPENFTSARLWGIAIADPRVPGYESAEIEVASTSLSCRIDGKNVVLNDDAGMLRGGLYQRFPWFATDSHDPMPLAYDPPNHSVVLQVGQRVDRIWHFWSPSPRAALPAGNLEGCTVHARVRISSGALLQMGMDYWRSPTVPYGAGGNNREAGASNWYFSSSQWQDASFTDIGGPQF